MSAWSVDLASIIMPTLEQAVAFGLGPPRPGPHPGGLQRKVFV